jgi:hypothetical protein
MGYHQQQQRSFRTPAYQVDFTASASGKTFGATKRRICFKFGFANPVALNDGCVGVQCRGQEHEVLCVWSVTSGKRQIFVDGKEAHTSSSSKAQAKFECNFNFMSEHVMKLTAHAAPPMASNNGFKQRQFDLLLDGQSFFEFKRLFELGSSSQTVAPSSRSLALVSPRNGNGSPREYNNYSFAQDPRDDEISPSDSRESIRSVNAYQDYHQQPSTKAVYENTRAPFEQVSLDLLDFSAPAQVAAPVPLSVQVPITTAPQYARAPAPIYTAPQAAPVPTYVAPSPTNYDYQQAQAQAAHHQQQSQTYQQTQYAPAPSQAPTMSAYENFQYQQSSYDVMKQYQDQQAPMTAPGSMQPMSTEDCTDIVAVSPERAAPTARLTMAPVNPFLHDEDEEQDLDEVTKAMKNLCNLDHITDDSKAKRIAKLSEKKEGNVIKDKYGKLKSKGLAPAATSKGASLHDIQSTKTQKAPTKSVMEQRTIYHAQAPQAGALVVYGAPPQQQGAPPLARGFGVGAQAGYTNYAY